MGERTRLTEGKPGEAGVQPGLHPTWRGSSVLQPCPAPTCHLPGPWVPVPPAAGFVTHDAPAAVSQNTESHRAAPGSGLGVAEPALF